MAYFKVDARQIQSEAHDRRRVARRSRRPARERRRLAPEPRRVVPAARPAPARRRGAGRGRHAKACTSSTKRRVRRFASCAIAALAAIALVAAQAQRRRPPPELRWRPSRSRRRRARLASQRIYFVMPDRYANGDDGERHREGSPGRGRDRLRPDRPGYYHGGDLAGLSANLQRIKDLGFTALWVTPVLKQDPVENGTAAYHGYWGLDFTTVDPHLGIGPGLRRPRRQGARARPEGLPRRRRQPHGGHRPADGHVLHGRPVSRLPRQDVQSGELRHAARSRA